MKQLLFIGLMASMIFGCKEKAKESNEEMNTATMADTQMEANDQDEWMVLFDGTSFEGWHGYLKEDMPQEWKLEEGAMIFYPPKDRPKGASYNLVTDKEFTDFVLSVDWKISEGGNSGIFWGVKEDPNLPEAYQSGPEIQVLDNERHPDAKAGTTHQAGALYDMVAPNHEMAKPAGEWNICVLTVNHKTNEGRVDLNGMTVVTFPVNDPEWSAMVAKSKFADWEHFGKYKTGKIGLQDHGDMVSYKNIKIKQL